MTIKIENKQQEQKTLENLGNEGYRWNGDVYPIDYKPSLTEGFNNIGFPYIIYISNNTITWDYDNKVEYIKTDNSKVNENLLKENELLKVQLSNIEEWLRTSVTGNESSEHILNLFFND
jgi:hypothetical protein